jgi:hypothetical protein
MARDRVGKSSVMYLASGYRLYIEVQDTSLNRCRGMQISWHPFPSVSHVMQQIMPVFIEYPDVLLCYIAITDHTSIICLALTEVF